MILKWLAGWNVAYRDECAALKDCEML